MSGTLNHTRDAGKVGSGMTRRQLVATAVGAAATAAVVAHGSRVTDADASEAKEKSASSHSGVSASAAADGSCALVLNAEKAASKWEFEVAPDPIAESDITDQVESDVIVVGAGPAGTFFAARYADDGGKAVLITKSPTAMGRGGTIFAVNSDFMKSQGLSIDADKVLKHEMFANSFNVDQKKWVRFFDHSSEAINWMHDTLKQDKGWHPYLQKPYEDPMGVISHVMGAHGMASDDNPKLDEYQVSVAMAEHAASKGVDVRYSTTAVQLEKDSSGRVTSVIAKDEDGKYVRFTGKKAVILATGDFTGDKEMMAKYCSWAKDVTGGVESGDGHKMALWAGAAWQRNLSVPMLNGNLGLSNESDGPVPTMVFDENGERFGNEDSNVVFNGLAQMRRPDSMNYTVFSQKMASNVTWYSYGTNRDLPPMSTDDVIAWWDGWVEQENVTTYAGAPNLRCYKADTIEELCGKFDLPTDKVLATVKRWNEMCEKGKDEDFHRNPDTMFAIDEPPYYMFGSLPWNLVQMGGIRCNEHMQAMDEDDAVLPGLYVLGMLVGDMYMSPYDFVCGGTNLGTTCLTFGYLLADELASGQLD
jgi:fumarate reductase flavoprotein subunit